jgi:hypothetical protein
MDRWMKAVFGVVASLALTGCAALDGHRPSEHPRDVEQESIPAVSSGECAGPEPTDQASLFEGAYELSDDIPESGTRVTLVGRPMGVLICTQLGCASSCCDNSCGYSPDCPYSLRVGENNEVCLQHGDYQCGGTDCSPWCEPFSTDPKHDYRFVGTLRHGEDVDAMGRVVLEVESQCRVE